MKNATTAQTSAATSAGISEESMARFGRIAADEAMKATAQWFRTQRPDLLKTINYDRAVELVREAVLSVMDEALGDCRAAFDAHMDNYLGATFLASMRLSGIKAAQKYAAEASS